MDDQPDWIEEQRALIDACIRHRAPFVWHGPGTFLISGAHIDAVLADVLHEGFTILGLEGFDLDPAIHPRLDLIFDAARRRDDGDPGLVARRVAAEFGKDVWIDISMARTPPAPRVIRRR